LRRFKATRRGGRASGSLAGRGWLGLAYLRNIGEKKYAGREVGQCGDLKRKGLGARLLMRGGIPGKGSKGMAKWEGKKRKRWEGRMGRP